MCLECLGDLCMVGNLPGPPVHGGRLDAVVEVPALHKVPGDDGPRAAARAQPVAALAPAAGENCTAAGVYFTRTGAYFTAAGA